MLAISCNGTTRGPVITIGPWTLKFARNAHGRRCNLYEASLFQSSSPQRRRLLCPALWVSRKGLLLLMATAKPVYRTEFDKLTYAALVMDQWDHLPNEEGSPFEPKPEDWGWYDGRLVAVDYSTLIH